MKLMKKTVLAMMVTSFASATAIAEVPDFSVEGMQWAPVPEGHVPGKDNGEDSGETAGNEFHFTGEDCGVCHRPGGKAEEHVFTMAGTLYKDRAGREPLKGGEIILQDSAGNVISMTTNDAGNFFTTAEIASDPQAWDETKTDEENKANARTWRYKAWVKNGDLVTSMMTIAAVGNAPGSTTERMSCGMHHAPLNSRGALLASGFPTLPDYPESGISFQKHVMPVLKNRCKSCHTPEAAKPWTEYPKGYKYAYGGGLDLSAFDKDPGSERGVADIVNTANPAASDMLIAPMYGSQHGGGASWLNTNDKDYKVIYQWIVEGAKNN